MPAKTLNRFFANIWQWTNQKPAAWAELPHQLSTDPKGAPSVDILLKSPIFTCKPDVKAAPKAAEKF